MLFLNDILLKNDILGDFYMMSFKDTILVRLACMQKLAYVSNHDLSVVCHCCCHWCLQTFLKT